MLFLIIIAILSFCYNIFLISKNKYKPLREVDNLKNALLTFALSTIRKDDFDSLNMIYNSFDGSKLPMLSGYDISNACFSYIIDKNEFKRSPFYTTGMSNKIEAIDRYIDKNLNTKEQVSDFFNDYVNHFTDKEDESKPEESSKKLD